VYETAQRDFDGVSVLCGVLDLPDDDLSELLGRREVEFRELRTWLEQIVQALNWLHEHGLCHGDLRPASIYLAGDEVKLGVDCIAPAAGACGKTDMRQLGALVVEAGTRESDPAAAERLPTPFREIALGCLAQDDPWTAQRVLEALSGRSASAATAEEPAPAPPVPATPGSSRRWAIPATGGAVVLILLALWWSGSKEERTAPVAATPRTEPALAAPPRAAEPAPETRQPEAAPPAEAPPPLPEREARQPEPAPETRQPEAAPPAEAPPPLPEREARQPEPAQREMPEAEASRPATGGSWAVIAATYGSYNSAQKRADRIHQRSPKLNPRVYPDEGQGRRYYILLGSGMSQSEAENLLRTARRLGAPGDSYATKLIEH
jgi:hypothetical protein